MIPIPAKVYPCMLLSRGRKSNPGQYRHGFRVLRKSGLVSPWIPGQARNGDGGVVSPWIPGQARNGDGGWYRHGFRVKPGMVTGGGIGITMDSGSSPEWERNINVFCYQIQKYVCDLIYSWQ